MGLEIGEDHVAVADDRIAIDDIGELTARCRSGIEDMLMDESEAGELQEGEDFQAIAVIVGDAEKLRIGIERDHGSPLPYVLIIAGAT